MLQAKEIASRFSHLQVTIDAAQRACQAAQDAPPEIRFASSVCRRNTARRKP